VVALREFGTDRVYVVGEGSRLCISPSGRSRATAERQVALVRRRSGWWVRALNGAHPGLVKYEDAPVRDWRLGPGMELTINGVTLIAESERSRALHDLLARVIGFSAEHRPAVDRALRAVLVAARGRRPLVLIGAGDLSSIARKLHHHTLADRPFVLCDRVRRPRSGGFGRAPVNIHDPLEALIAAAGGTLCVPTDRLPEGFEPMISRWRESKTRIQLILCAPSTSPVLSATSDPIVMVPLSMRWHDRFRIMNDVITETAAEFGIPAIEISRADRELIVASEAETLPELERTTTRVVAIRHWPRAGAVLVVRRARSEYRVPRLLNGRRDAA
jgi:hypothetical protein